MFLLHNVKAVTQKSLATPPQLFNLVVQLGFDLGKSRIYALTKMSHDYPLTQKSIPLFESAARIPSMTSSHVLIMI